MWNVEDGGAGKRSITDFFSVEAWLHIMLGPPWSHKFTVNEELHIPGIELAILLWKFNYLTKAGAQIQLCLIELRKCLSRHGQEMFVNANKCRNCSRSLHLDYGIES
jgi:hypothetical protein